jgi:cystathionine beta-lyase/cystathionine gamma-synthase
MIICARSGFGGMSSFESKDRYEAADKCLNGLLLALQAPSLDGVKTLAGTLASSDVPFRRPLGTLRS